MWTRAHLLPHRAVVEPGAPPRCGEAIQSREYIVVAPGRYLVQFLCAGNTMLFESPLTLTAGEREFLVDVSQRTLRALQ